MRARIDPGIAPGGLVVRVVRHDGTVVWWDPIPHMDSLEAGELRDWTARHREVARDNTTPGHPVQVQLFDGDTGALLTAFVVIVDTNES